MIVNYLAGPDFKLSPTQVKDAMLSIVDGIGLPLCYAGDASKIFDVWTGTSSLLGAQSTVYSIITGGPWTVLVCDGLKCQTELLECRQPQEFLDYIVECRARNLIPDPVDVMQYEEVNVYDEDDEERIFGSLEIFVLPFEATNIWQA